MNNKQARKEAREHAEVMLAYADGKEIQFKRPGNVNTEYFSASTPVWNWIEYLFRVKPEPEYIPWTVRTCRVGATVKDKKTDYGSVILANSFKGCCLMTASDEIQIFRITYFTYLGLFETHVQDDGSPCGTTVEGL